MKPRVMLLCPAGFVGGAERGALNLSVALGEEFDLAIAAPDGQIHETAAKAGIKSIRVEVPREISGLTRQAGTLAENSSTGLKRLASGFLASGTAAARGIIDYAKQIAGAARFTRADLIHANGLKATIPSGLAAAFLGIPAVWHFRDIISDRGLALALEGSARLLASAAVFNSKATSESVLRLGASGPAGPWPGLPCEIVPNGVPLPPAPRDPALRNAARKRLGISGNPLLIAVGHLAPLKGHDFLIRAMPAILRALPDAKLAIIGGEPYGSAGVGHSGRAAELAALAEEAGGFRRIVLAGPTTDTDSWYRAADMFILPSLSEGFGRAAAEALSYGLPVVASRVGGIPEVLCEAGVMVPPGDPGAIAAAVIAIFTEPGRADFLGNAGLERAAANFDIKITSRRIAEIWHRLLPGGSI